VPAEVNVRALLEKYVGKEAGDSIAANIEPMIGAKRAPLRSRRCSKRASPHIMRSRRTPPTQNSVFSF